jgi:hypothetical protein
MGSRREPWWVRTVHLALVAVLGGLAILVRADPRLVLGIAVMACAALGWTGPWPTITFGGRRDPDH